MATGKPDNEHFDDTPFLRKRKRPSDESGKDESAEVTSAEDNDESAEVTSAEDKRERPRFMSLASRYPQPEELRKLLDFMHELFPPGVCRDAIPNEEAFFCTAYKVMRNSDPMDISHEEILEVMTVVQYFAEPEDERLLISDNTENKAKTLARVTDTETLFTSYGSKTPPMELAIKEVRRMFWAALNTLSNIATFTRNNTRRNRLLRKQMERDEMGLSSPLLTIPH